MPRMYTILLLAAAITSSTGSQLFDYNCLENEFICRDMSKCISSSKICDNIIDCSDGSDERQCELFLCKKPYYFRCNNSRCVSTSSLCDGENDCIDNSDEMICDYIKTLEPTNSSCEEDYFKCSDKHCIPKAWVCDSKSDCMDESDELGCIECESYKCKNGHCVQLQLVCDGRNNCQDDSDEENCENHVDTKKCTWDDQKFLCSNNNTCIDLSFVCDGNPHCPDKSDENFLCSVPWMNCTMHGCSHKCVQMPTGPKCLCPKGYQNIVEEKLCKDINECEVDDICDHKCRNTPGSYECYCEHTYILQEDKKTCKFVGGEAMMVFSLKTEIQGYLLTPELNFPIVNQLNLKTFPKKLKDWIQGS